MTDANTDSSTAPAPSAPAPDRKLVVVAAVLAVALVAALVGLILTWRVLESERDEVAQDKSALNDAKGAAGEAIERMTSYDYRSLDEDFSWVGEVGTDKFRDTFAQSADLTRKLVRQTKGHADGEVVRSSAELEDDSTVHVLMFVDQTLSSSDNDESAVELSRVEMTMVLRDGSWLVDDVNILNPAGQVPTAP